MSYTTAVRRRAAGLPLEPLRRLLEQHRGAGNAIKLKDIAVILALKDRDPGRAIRDAVVELIASGVPVGSIATESGGGYFTVTNERELQRCVAQLRSRVEEIELRIERLVAAFRNGPPQPKLFRAEGAVETLTAPTTSASTERPAPIEHRHAEPFTPDFRAVIDRLSRTTPERATGRARRGAL